MEGSRFCRYELRTRDVKAARAFYTEVLGSPLWEGDVSIAALPERAAALGAPAHWLGYIGTRDVQETARRAVALGGQRLGSPAPTTSASDAASYAILRDPFGSVFAIGAEPAVAPPAAVAFRLLHTEDSQRAFVFYASLFGWTATETLDLGPEIGCHLQFAWDDSGRCVGSIANTVRLPHVHPHWLFYFPVTDIEDALARVRAHGGQPLAPMRMPSGDLVAPCDDPQGAAFALYQVAPG